MDAENNTANEIQPVSTPEPDFQKQFDKYLRNAKCDAENAAFEALPFIRAPKPSERKTGNYKKTFWAPEYLREVTHDERDIAYEAGGLYAQMLAAHCQKYSPSPFTIRRIIEAVFDAAREYPRRGASVRSGFLMGVAGFALAGMRASRNH